MPATPKKAADALIEFAGLGQTQANEVVKAVVAAARREALELLGGNEPVPSNLSDLRALRLRWIAEELKRPPRNIEVQAIFRVTERAAKTIKERMLATYLPALDPVFRGEIKQATSVRHHGSVESGNRVTVTFNDESLCDYAYQLYVRARLAADVTRGELTLEMPAEFRNAAGASVRALAVLDLT